MGTVVARPAPPGATQSTPRRTARARQEPL